MTKTKMTFTIDEQTAVIARRRSDESGVPLSVAVERLLSEWARTGELPPVPPVLDKPKRKKR